jgi:hypothetical protein
MSRKVNTELSQLPKELLVHILPFLGHTDATSVHVMDEWFERVKAWFNEQLPVSQSGWTPITTLKDYVYVEEESTVKCHLGSVRRDIRVFDKVFDVYVIYSQDGSLMPFHVYNSMIIPDKCESHYARYKTLLNVRQAVQNARLKTPK